MASANSASTSAQAMSSAIGANGDSAITMNDVDGSPKKSRIKASMMNGDSIPSLQGLEIRVIDDFVGRGVFATKPFKKGDLVMYDTPIVTCQFAWSYLYKYKACEYCLRALETAEENVRRLAQSPTLVLSHPELCETQKHLHVSCDLCPAMYCSEDCKQKAFQDYHSILCFGTKVPPENHPLKLLDSYWRGIHYPPETFNIMLLVKLLAMLHKDKDGTLNARLSKFCNSTTEQNEIVAHKALGDEYALQINRLRELVGAALNYSNIQEWLTPEGFLKLFVVIGRNGQGVGTSPFAVWVNNVENSDISGEEKQVLLDRIDALYNQMDAVVGHFLDNEGSALYPFQSWVNHSCIPNTEVKFPDKNHNIGLTALKDIEVGEEITICYLDLGDLERSRYTRNKYLLEHYLFECTCLKCIAQMDDPNITSDDSDDEYEDMDDEDEDDMD